MLFLCGKGEVVPVHSMKAYKVGGVLTPPILNFSTRWMSEGNKAFLPINLRRKSSGTQGIGGWVNPRASPGVVEREQSIYPAGI
jgi:hypothetical protein